ncbi:alpha-galactosidase [Seonamhaeicola marinus]|uniref:Alpha-galactosidase n=2 Tax=Seonamhaeicola marinus TaxID=1912246 RepID=A0A5D0HWY7_9FLAO|nr:alpha-galactosidase [Seonamhaeicola marinus]
MGLEKEILVNGKSDNPLVEIHQIFHENEVSVYDVKINNEKGASPITLSWKIPAHNIMGVWKPTTDFAKRIQADWELDHMESRISIDAPVIGLFGHNDTNIHTFACSDVINKLDLNARIREEDDCFYCHLTLCQENQGQNGAYNIQIRIDEEDKHFSKALMATSKWWESFQNLKPAPVPEIALEPLYSTWYNFHQVLDEDVLIEECKTAYKLGYRSIIIDDGWQTNDANRGYDFTGDWKPERITKTKAFVERVHSTGMKIGFWYSVPFCGNKSEAYKRFKGKFLTEDHRWAPVFDPRYPEVRSYLIDIYKNALLDWNLDGFKLDFIDDFKLYKDTPSKNDNMDFHSVNEAVDRLLTDVMETLRAIKPDIFIEFRQKYTGPAMRKYGNMFRAFDCPGDATMNRIRIADINMLAGNTAVHSDMITWHNEEKLEVAALQMVNTLFGVPQVSVKLNEIPKDHLEMLKFYTNYWVANKSLITTGDFTPFKPLANYPLQHVKNNNKLIIGLHDDYVVNLDVSYKNIDILNAKLSTETILKVGADLGNYNYSIFNCKGELVDNGSVEFKIGLVEFNIPACGLIQLNKK